MNFDFYSKADVLEITLWESLSGLRSGVARIKTKHLSLIKRFVVNQAPGWAGDLRAIFPAYKPALASCMAVRCTHNQIITVQLYSNLSEYSSGSLNEK